MLTCAIDFETGGLSAGYHPALSVAIVPLLPNFMPDDSKEAFICDIGVDNMDRVDPGALKVNGFSRERIIAAGERKDSVRKFFAWKEQFGKFAPLAQNWAFDKGFFQHWIDPQHIQPKIFETLLDYRARDLARVVMYAMDREAAHGMPKTFGGSSLGKICERLGVVNRAPHSAYGDACATAECYSKLITS